jgi:hypothetical protein
MKFCEVRGIISLGRGHGGIALHKCFIDPDLALDVKRGGGWLDVMDRASAYEGISVYRAVHTSR